MNFIIGLGEIVAVTGSGKLALMAIDHFLTESNWISTTLKCGAIASTIFINAYVMSLAASRNRTCRCAGLLTGTTSGLITTFCFSALKGATGALIGGSLVGIGATYLTVKMCKEILG